MLVKNHVPVALSCWALAGPVLGFPIALVALTLPAAAFAGTLPDIDHPSSWLGRRLPGVSHLVRLVLGHRGGTHSLLAVLGCFLGLTYLRTHTNLSSLSVAGATIVTSAILVGYLSHILADALTKSGVPLLWPLRKSFRSPIAFTTGGMVENIVTFIIVVFAGWYTWVHHLAPLI